jgi:hypothetical protein
LLELIALLVEESTNLRHTSGVVQMLAYPAETLLLTEKRMHFDHFG